ncbi:MAG: hypothetical protein ACRDN0_00175, partial [Trebonia sp.]
MNRADARLISRIVQVTDDEAATMVPAATFGDLAAGITAEPAGDAPSVRPVAPRSRRRMVFGIPVACAAAAAGVAVGLAVTSGAHSAPPASKPPARASTSLPPAASKVLAFTEKAGYITVIVKNPYADPAWYNADFKAHHLDITLREIPVSPSMVGTVPYTDASSSAVESEVTMIYAKCTSAPSGGNR